MKPHLSCVALIGLAACGGGYGECVPWPDQMTVATYSVEVHEAPDIWDVTLEVIDGNRVRIGWTDETGQHEAVYQGEFKY